MRRKEDHRYDDIIALPHHVSPKRTPMPSAIRAAQFAPFAALSGYDDAVSETARLTVRRKELDEESLERLSKQLRWLADAAGSQPEATFLLFEPDEKKTGGAYISVTGHVRRVDEVQRKIHLTDRRVLPMDRIDEIHSPFFPSEEDMV